MKIPRAEVKELFDSVKKVAVSLDEDYILEVCGSYRRGAETSGRIHIQHLLPGGFLALQAPQFNGKSTSKKNVPKVWSSPPFKALKNVQFFYFKLFGRAPWEKIEFKYLKQL